MKIEELDHRPAFASAEEMVDHFAAGAKVLGVCVARVRAGTRKIRLLALGLLGIAAVALLQEVVGRAFFEWFAPALPALLTEEGLAILFLLGIALFVGFYIYRLVRPKADLFVVTEAGVFGLDGVRQSIHGVSAEKLLAIPADEIGKFRFSKLAFPGASMVLEDRDSHDALWVSQHRLWNKRRAAGERGRSLRDILSVLRSLALDAKGERWGTEGSMMALHSKVFGLMLAVMTAGVILLAGVVAFLEPDVAEVSQEAVAAYERRDFAEAHALFAQAATRGDPAAQTYLGQMYERGEGLPAADLAEARRWYAAAAEGGHIPAQSALGYLLMLGGPGVPQDLTEAVHWLGLAAEADDPRALTNLGWLHLEGHLGARDHRQALRLYLLAAEQAYAPAQYAAGYMYDRGLGTPSDYASAMRWYGRAAEQGDTIAAASMRVLEGQRAAREAVDSLELAMRWSALGDRTQVLRMTNTRDYAVRFDLRCFKLDGDSGTIPVSIAGRSVQEIGFLEGWPGNFVTGERCEIRLGEALLREFSIP